MVIKKLEHLITSSVEPIPNLLREATLVSIQKWVVNLKLTLSNKIAKLMIYIFLYHYSFA